MKKGIYLLLLLSISVHFLANAQDNAGLTLPTGFKANLFAENIGSARHIAISKNGVVFAKLNRADKQGRTIIRLADENKDGVSDNVTGWANYGGTGIYLTGNALYASSNEAIFKYQLDGKDEVVNPLSPITVVTGLINRRQHESKSITFDKANNIYVNIGAYSNACQEKDRTPGGKGMMPCPILDSAGGIWKFDASKENQTYGDGKKICYWFKKCYRTRLESTSQ